MEETCTIIGIVENKRNANTLTPPTTETTVIDKENVAKELRLNPSDSSDINQDYSEDNIPSKQSNWN